MKLPDELSTDVTKYHDNFVKYENIDAVRDCMSSQWSQVVYPGQKSMSGLNRVYLLLLFKNVSTFLKSQLIVYIAMLQQRPPFN